jgi:hypothetical protein
MDPMPTPEIIAAAQAAQAKWGIPAAISLAQYGIESGWGAHEPPGSFNGFGIKSVPGQPSVTVPTHEFVGGRYIVINAAFAAYPSVAGAFNAHAELLATSHYYEAARAAIAGGITEASTDAFANALTGVYATAPNYGGSLIALMRSDNLYAYNGASLAAQPTSMQSSLSPAPPASPSIPPPGPSLQPIAVAPILTPPIPLTPSVPQLPPAFVPAPVAATAPTLTTVATPARVGATVALTGLVAGASAMASTHIVDLKGLIDLAFLYLVAPVVLGIVVGLATSLAKLLNINIQGQVAQRVLTATENGAMAVVSKAQTAADAGTITTKNDMIAGTLNYLNAAVPDAVKTLGLATPTGQGILANLAEAKVQAAVASITPKAPA